MTTPKLAVSVRRVHAEPAIEGAPSHGAEVPWIALWDDGTVVGYPAARALLRAVRQRDRHDAAAADRRGHGALFATIITWNNPPSGFVPPEDRARAKPR